MNDIEKRVTGILRGIKPHQEESINPKADLFALGLLDSFGMISYIMSLEKEFAITVPNESLIAQNFWSIEATAQTITTLLNERK